MAQKSQNLTSEAFKDSVVEALDSIGDVAHNLVTTIERTLTGSLSEVSEAGADLEQTVVNAASGAVDAAQEIGEPVGDAAEGTMLGILRGSQRTGSEALDLISTAAHAIVIRTASLGGDAASAARGAIEGAIHASSDLGIEADEAARTAAQAAAVAADNFTETTLKRVNKVSAETLKRIDTTLREPFQDGDDYDERD